jgi:hypothetical protein
MKKVDLLADYYITVLVYGVQGFCQLFYGE